MLNNELESHIAEYKSTQQILNFRYKVEHNIHYLSFLLLVPSISLCFQFFIRPEYQEYLYFLLIIPFPFHLLAFMFLRNDLIIAANAKYYNKILRPRVKKICNCDVWMREDIIFRTTRKGFFNILLGGFRYLTTLGACPLFVCIFILFRDNNFNFTSRELFLLILNFIITVFIVILASKKVLKAVKDIVN